MSVIPSKVIKLNSSLSFVRGCVLLSIRVFLYWISSVFIIYTETIIEWELLNSRSSRVYLILIFDYISLFFLSLVLLISGRVIIYRNSYISSEQYNSRFISLVLCFVLSIALLILSPNIIRILLGWDGLGVTSYLLVIFYQRSKSYNAGIITALTNRLGDVGILITIGLFVSSGDWTFSYVRDLNDFYGFMIIIILTLSACTKSAQIPFSAWLPAAIAAPTPVSALVHSSTLVTAGVYLLIRFNNLLTGALRTHILFLFGVLTTIIAGTAAMLEIDIKKVIALSTLRQLGVIMTIIGFGKPLLAYLHLLSHAYFKAILFMCAGIVIHNMKDYQDLRSMGRINCNMPTVSGLINVANLRLCGLPFIRGFYSKDSILEALFISETNLIFFILVLLATGLTVSYSCRLSLCLSSFRLKLERIYSTTEIDKYMLFGIYVLLPFSIMGGYNLIWQITSFNQFVYLPFWIKLIISCLILFRLLAIYGIIRRAGVINSSSIAYFLSTMWFMPLLFRSASTILSLGYGKATIKDSELGWAEILIFKYFHQKIKRVSLPLYRILSNYFLSTFLVFIIILLLT